MKHTSLINCLTSFVLFCSQYLQLLICIRFSQHCSAGGCTHIEFPTDSHCKWMTSGHFVATHHGQRKHGGQWDRMCACRRESRQSMSVSDYGDQACVSHTDLSDIQGRSWARPSVKTHADTHVLREERKKKRVRSLASEKRFLDRLSFRWGISFLGDVGCF